jgi:hypothetical protein
MDHSTWIANLMTGQISEEEQATRAQFRAMQAAKPQPAPRAKLGVVTTAGPNAWAVSTGDDELATYTLLDGPGRWANCTAK